MFHVVCVVAWFFFLRRVVPSEKSHVVICSHRLGRREKFRNRYNIFIREDHEKGMTRHTVGRLRRVVVGDGAAGWREGALLIASRTGVHGNTHVLAKGSVVTFYASWHNGPSAPKDGYLSRFVIPKCVGCVFGLFVRRFARTLRRDCRGKKARQKGRKEEGRKEGEREGEGKRERDK